MSTIATSNADASNSFSPAAAVATDLEMMDPRHDGHHRPYVRLIIDHENTAQ
jgi:hypothetical protein